MAGHGGVVSGESGRRLRGDGIPHIAWRGRGGGHVDAYPHQWFLRLDGNELSGLLFHTERVRLNISADASMPVNSTRNTARIGMPDLDAAISEMRPSSGPWLETARTAVEFVEDDYRRIGQDRPGQREALPLTAG